MAWDLIGKDFVPPDIRGKVTGAAKYAEDYRAEGMVFGRVLTSPVPHANIVNIDASEALAMDGVLGILTADDEGLDGLLKLRIEVQPPSLVDVLRACGRGERNERHRDCDRDETAADPHAPIIPPRCLVISALQGQGRASDVDAAVGEEVLEPRRVGVLETIGDRLGAAEVQVQSVNGEVTRESMLNLT